MLRYILWRWVDTQASLGPPPGAPFGANMLLMGHYNMPPVEAATDIAEVAGHLLLLVTACHDKNRNNDCRHPPT